MELLSCNIIERDCNNDVLWAWTYPSCSETQKQLILRKCNFEQSYSFLFGRYKHEWFYLNLTDVFESDNLNGVKQFALVIWAKDFNPDKYETLCRILSKTYCKTGNPTMLLKLYLSVVTRGACSTEENGTYYTKDFERSVLQNNKTMVKDLIQLFGLETIIIYTALLLKKRLVVYHHSLPQLLKWMRTFPALMSHRSESEQLYPWVDLCAEELQQFSGSPNYIVGCIDSRVLSRPDLFDVLVNIPARETTIAPHAKESLSMTKAHKEIALFLVQLGEKEDIQEPQIIQEIGDKTRELLDHLRSLAVEGENGGKKLLSQDKIRSKKFSAGVENFLLQLASAENLLS